MAVDDGSIAHVPAGQMQLPFVGVVFMIAGQSKIRVVMMVDGFPLHQWVHVPDCRRRNGCCQQCAC